MNRARRNSNPGNVRQTTPRTQWQGRVPSERLTETEFEQFEGPEWGARALARTLITYQDAHGIRTIAGIINRWAPPAGQNSDGSTYQQDTAAYIRHVEQLTGFDSEQALDLHTWAHLRTLVAAIAHHESGSAWPPDELDQGVILAGVKPPLRPIAQTKTGAGIGLTTAGVAMQVADVDKLAEQIAPIAQHSAIVAGVIAGTIAAGLLLTVYGRWQAQRRTGV